MKFYITIFTTICLLLQITTTIWAQRSGPPILAKTPSNIDVKSLQTSLERISAGAESFALELLKQLSDAHVSKPTQSYMVSPFAIWSLLLLLAEGAQGVTLQELQRTMRLDNDFQAVQLAYKGINKLLKVNTSTIEVASYQALFTDINKPVSRDYETLLDRVYEAALVPVNFSDVNRTYTQINDEINRATRGLLPSTVTPQDFKDAALLMISSLYFKGMWKYPFEKSETISVPFHDEQYNVLGNVQMMTQTGPFNYINMRSMESYILELPYGKENRLSMLIILPKRSVSLNSVVGKLRNIGVKPIIDELKHVAKLNEEEDIQDLIEVYLPKFTTTSHFSLRPILGRMGIIDVFEPNYANLEKMTKNVYVGGIFQSTRIIVNEEGTEAAAVTTAVLVNKASPTKFYLDRPFAYLIVEKISGLLLFAGEVKSHEFN